MHPMAPWRRDILWLGAILALFLGSTLGFLPYITPSEARYIEIPRQMLATGDFVTPRINGVPYFEKPPLFYWLQAAIISVGGLSEFSGRLGTMLLFIATCLITYGVGRLLYGRACGIMAALVLGTSLLGFGMSRLVLLDVPISFFITATLGCFIAAQKSHARNRARRYYIGMYVAAACGLLTKGLIGLVIPGLVIGIWLMLTRRWDILRRAQLLSGLALMVLIALPWHWSVAQVNPDFWRFYFLQEHFTRYLSSMHARTQPWWFFLAVMVAGLLPWIGMLPMALRRLWLKNDGLGWLLIVWVVIPLSFFSSSQSKLAPYILPIFPPLSIIIGAYLAQVWQSRRATLSLRAGGLSVVALFAVAAAAVPLLSGLQGKPGRVLMNANELLPEFTPILVMLVPLFLVLAVGRSARLIIATLALFAATCDITLNLAATHINQSSMRSLALLLKPRLQPQDSVVAYGSYWQDLPVYLERTIAVAGWQGELAYGITHFPATGVWMFPANEFLLRCAGAQAGFYVFINRAEWEGLTLPPICRLSEIARQDDIILLQKDNP